MKREKKNAKQVKTITWKSLKPLPPEEVDEMFPVAKLIDNGCESDTQQVRIFWLVSDAKKTLESYTHSHTWNAIQIEICVSDSTREKVSFISTSRGLSVFNAKEPFRVLLQARAAPLRGEEGQRVGRLFLYDGPCVAI